ncbi:MAG: TPM domain-containing protein [Candidatus Binatia bacterium]
MRRIVAFALVACVAAGALAASEPAIAPPQGFVTDGAGVVGPAVRARLTGLLQELQAKTGAEIAVVTVDTTAPLDDFTYAMRVAEAWKPGRKREDTGLVFVVAVKDRKLRVVTGYGLEGILPDGLVGQIQDEEVVPSFRAGRIDEGIERGVRAYASRIAAAKGVRLTGVPPPRPRQQPLPGWLVLLVLMLVLAFFVYVASQQPGLGVLRRRRDVFDPGGFGGGFGGGGGGGFGGFSGGAFGGGGAGRSW